MSLIKDLFAKKTRPSLSFEFFTPKTEQGRENLFETAKTLVEQTRPDFLSVTYGAGGSTRENTSAIVIELQAGLKLPVMHHLTCIGHSQTELKTIIEDLKQARIMNILALRGDPPKGTDTWKAHPEGYNYAWELVELIRELAPEAVVAGAGFPEGHPESPDLETDARLLKSKIDAGCSFLITQLFFEVKLYQDYLERAQRHGVAVPILPGILPVTNYQNLINFTNGCQASLPDFIHERFAPLADDEEQTRQAGIELAIKQCRALLALGAPGLHFYTLNRIEPVLSIVKGLGLDRQDA